MITNNKKDFKMLHDSAIKSTTKRKGCPYFWCVFTESGLIKSRFSKTERKSLNTAFIEISHHTKCICVMSYKCDIYSIIKNEEI